MDDFHSALKTTIIKEASGGGVHYKHVLLQNGKNDFTHTLHAHPSSWSNAGLQTTDLLHFLGFKRSPCAFHMGECYVREIPASLDAVEFAKTFVLAFQYIESGASYLEKCGIHIDQPEGVGFFYHSPSSGRRFSSPHLRTNGHVAAKSTRIKETEDQFFNFVFTWIDGAGGKGWTTHYRAKHMPLSPEFGAVLNFLGEFSAFPECPEFDFEACWWRFIPFKADERGIMGLNNEYAYKCFDAHATNFSPGIEKLLAAHAVLQKHGISFLSIPKQDAQPLPDEVTKKTVTTNMRQSMSKYEYDVAISFAGTERRYAETLAHKVKEAGFKVFYDYFYTEQLWGKDLTAFFDQVYRKDSRFCVMLVSAQYAERIWTIHERRSAQARALEEKGREYILPIRVDDTDLDGLPPTLGYLSLEKCSIEDIATILIKKLESS